MPTRLTSLATRFAKAVGGDSSNLSGDPATPTAAAIQDRITATQAELATLAPEHARAALAAVAGDPEADTRETELAQRIEGLESTLRRLRAAYTIAKEREDAAARELRLENQAALRERTKKLIAKRSKHAEDLEAGISQAVHAFQKLHEYNMRIRATFPWGSRLGGTMLAEADLQRQVAFEMFRQAARVLASPDPAWPGAVCPDERLRGRPDAIPSLASVIEQANSHAISIMEEGKIVPMTVPPAPATEGGE